MLPSRKPTEQFIGPYLFCADGTGATSGNCGVASNVFGSSFDDFLRKGYNAPGGSGPDALDNLRLIGFTDWCLGWVWGRAPSGSEVVAGPIATGHPDGPGDILCQPYDERNFVALATGGATHTAAVKSAILSRNMRPPIIYQGCLDESQSTANADLDAACQTAIDTGSPVAFDAISALTRDDPANPTLMCVDRLRATHGIGVLGESWERTDVTDCMEWLAKFRGVIATGGNGSDTATFRADNVHFETSGAHWNRDIVRSYGAGSIVIIAYNGVDASVRLEYIRRWWDWGYSVLFDPIGFSQAQLVQIYKLSQSPRVTLRALPRTSLHGNVDPNDIADLRKTLRLMSLRTASAGTSPQWQKYTVSYKALATADTDNTMVLFTLPALGIIHGIAMKHSEAFTGGSLSSYTISVGVAGSLTRYQSARDVLQSPSGTMFWFTQPTPPVGLESFTSDIDVLVAATGSHNLNTATAGSVDIWALVSQLPA